MGQILDGYFEKYKIYVKSNIDNAMEKEPHKCEMVGYKMWVAQMVCEDNGCEPWEPCFLELMKDLEKKDPELVELLSETILYFLEKTE